MFIILYLFNNFILIPGSVKKQLGSGLRFLAGVHEYGSNTLPSKSIHCMKSKSHRRMLSHDLNVYAAQLCFY